MERMWYIAYVWLMMDYRGKKMRIVGTGLICLDIIHKNEDIILMNGGTCANVLTVLAQLGEEATVLIPRYNTDDQKEFFYKTLEELGVNCVYYCKTKKNIPRIIEVYDERKKHLFYTKCWKCERDLLENRFITQKEAELLMPQIMDNDVFFTDRISSGIKYIAREYMSMNRKVIYEPNSARNLKAVIEMSKLANVVKFSTDRISLETAGIILEQCAEGALELVIATRGERGMSFCYRIDEKHFSEWMEGPSIEFVHIKDTSGAGDWLTAGFLHFWSQEKYSLEQDKIFNMLKKALELSAICSRIEGAQGAFYDRELFDCLKEKYHIILRDKMIMKIPETNRNEGEVCDNCFI